MVQVDETLAMLEALAIEAGQIILRIRANGAGARLKHDGSPVTDADQAAEEHITAGLRRIEWGTPIIAEECACNGSVPSISTDRFFLVDPLDGTKEFIKGRSDFTVNISLIEGGVPASGRRCCASPRRTLQRRIRHRLSLSNFGRRFRR
jgi:3'(2'), 5'-bisphosphate nucleotidase